LIGRLNEKDGKGGRKKNRKEVVYNGVGEWRSVLR